ncbi:hypothetical protein [uncultured Mailhella sp.]|uniref:hypothetical protein n=1 Tax=uncultured Mailhella sp. TaxID=1981031 RepID=UPI00260386FD|nr:hypothetical protein [uncultured Mailhella sp.]
MKKELLKYLAGLCQAASAALMASAVIMGEYGQNPYLAVSCVPALEQVLSSSRRKHNDKRLDVYPWTWRGNSGSIFSYS